MLYFDDQEGPAQWLQDEGVSRLDPHVGLQVLGNVGPDVVATQSADLGSRAEARFVAESGLNDDAVGGRIITAGSTTGTNQASKVGNNDQAEPGPLGVC